MSNSSLTLFSNSKNQYTISSRIGSGGEGDVYDIGGPVNSGLVAKIYKEPVTEEKREKLFAMVGAFDEKLQLIAAWPKELLFDNSDKLRGFVMPKVVDFKPIHELFNPSARKKNYPRADWAFLVNTARNVVAAFHTIHSKGFIVGDVNEGNLMVSNASTVKFIDCDSFQVSKNGRIYPCEVGVPMYTPPELQSLKSFRDSKRTINHDIFGMAIICFQLLFMGRHPYVGIYHGPDIALEKAIEKCLFAYGNSARTKGISPPQEAVNYDSIPQTLKVLFERTFTETGTAERPASIKWFEEFNQLKAHIKTCRNEEIHKHYESLDVCPWCDLENNRGIFFFLSSKIGSFNLKGFNLQEVWNKILAINLPNEEFPDTSKIKIEHGKIPSRYLLFRFFQFTLKISSFVVPFILLLNYPKLFLIHIPLGILLFNLKLFDKPVDAERDKRRNAFEYAKVKWDEIQNKWTRDAGSFFLDRRLKELKEVKEKYERLGSEYTKERQLLYSRMEELQLQKFLSNYSIRNHNIPNIGETRKFTLSSFGIDTAADILKLVKVKVPGFGDFLEGQLYTWRDTLARRFKFDQAKGLDPEEINQLNRKFESLKLQYQNQIVGGIEALMVIKNQILKNRISMKREIEIVATAYRKAESDWRKLLF